MDRTPRTRRNQRIVSKGVQTIRITSRLETKVTHEIRKLSESTSEQPNKQSSNQPIPTLRTAVSIEQHRCPTWKYNNYNRICMFRVLAERPERKSLHPLWLYWFASRRIWRPSELSPMPARWSAVHPRLSRKFKSARCSISKRMHTSLGPQVGWCMLMDWNHRDILVLEELASGDPVTQNHLFPLIVVWSKILRRQPLSSFTHFTCFVILDPRHIVAELSTNHKQRHALFNVKSLLMRLDGVIDIRLASKQFFHNLCMAPQCCEACRAPAKLIFSSTPGNHKVKVFHGNPTYNLKSTSTKTYKNNAKMAQNSSNPLQNLSISKALKAILLHEVRQLQLISNYQGLGWACAFNSKACLPHVDVLQIQHHTIHLELWVLHAGNQFRP